MQTNAFIAVTPEAMTYGWHVTPEAMTYGWHVAPEAMTYGWLACHAGGDDLRLAGMSRRRR